MTCRDWFQLTLKEGLTVFRDQEFSADMNRCGSAVCAVRCVLCLWAWRWEFITAQPLTPLHPPQPKIP